MKEGVQKSTDKKPLYKKWWFWVIVCVVGLLIIAGASGSSGSESNTNNNSDSGREELNNSKPQVAVIDFSQMSIEDITAWCTENNVNCYKKTDYSDTVQKDGFVSQSVKSGDKISEGKDINITYSLGKAPTTSQKNALRQAQSYLSHSAFSYQSLIGQLEYEGYSNVDAVYAVDNCGADWNEQAYQKAKSYLSRSSFSLNSLISQLEYEKFTKEQARYGAEKAYNE